MCAMYHSCPLLEPTGFPLNPLTGELRVDAEVVEQLHDLADDLFSTGLCLDVAVLEALDGRYERVHVPLGLEDLCG